MLKEVGASGQVSLGKKYAGQLFDMQAGADGTITFTPVKVVPMVQETSPAYAEASAATNAQWVQENAQQIAQYNAWAEQRKPYSQRVREWRKGQK